MIIKTFPSGPFETNAYVIGCPATKQAVIIDPAQGSSKPVIAFLSENDLTPIIILITHSHWDHIIDTAILKNHFNIPVCIHALDRPNLEKPGSDRLPCPIPYEGVVPNRLLQEGDEVNVGNIRFKVIHTPGHSPGGVCFYCADEGVLISGDTLFRGSIGNLSLPTANAELMWQSLAKLSKLPPETIAYPGHGPSTTIGREPWLARAKDHFSG